VLLGSLLGEPFSWLAQQGGRLVHNILPMPEYENDQVGTSSSVELAWHTEDAFHEARGDYLCLLCLKNPDKVPTTVAHMADVNFEDPRFSCLYEARFRIWPDDSYFESFSARSGRDVTTTERAAFQAMERLRGSPPLVSVLFGRRSDPYVRIDPAYMSACEGDEEAQEALDYLIGLIDSRMQQLVLEPGNLLIIDNYRAVHGRKPFKARYDGNDRWLKRLNVTRDLRRSAACRDNPLSRMVIY
jgi:Fe(II)/alpha-ketoglutarate-dependent arginine beta-hydroxylase